MEEIILPTTFFGWISFLWKEYWPLLMKGAGTSLLIAFTGTALGFLVGLLVAIVRTIPLEKNDHPIKKFFIRIAQLIAVAYIEVFRGTPLMVQAMVIYYGLLRYTSLRLPLLVASTLIIGTNTGAYMCEIMRSGIVSIDKGQSEASKSFGMSHWQAMRHVILPQAIRNVLPSIGNELVVNVKDTSVLNVIAVSELFFVGKGASGTYLKYFEVYTIIACIYLVITLILSNLLKALEKRLDGPTNYQMIDARSERHE